MIVIVVSACPTGLRGHLTRWLLEISAGVFVGKVTTRVRELLWLRTVDMVKTGRSWSSRPTTSKVSISALTSTT